MARTRSIKPEFWSDEKSGCLEPVEKCLFLGILNFCDDEGLVRANPLYLKSVIFPYNKQITDEDIELMLTKFDKLELVYLYVRNQQKYAWVIKFRVYQRIDKPQKPNNPAPRIADDKYKRAIFKRDSFTCHLCGKFTDLEAVDYETHPNPPRHGNNFPSIDHVIPKSKGGSDYPSNLKTACLSCNKGRKDKELDEVVPRTFQERSKNTPEQTETETETETETSTRPSINTRSRNISRTKGHTSNHSDSTSPPFSNPDKNNWISKTAGQVYAYYIQETGRNPKTYRFTKARRSKVISRIKELKANGMRPKEIETYMFAGIAGCIDNPWNAGDNPQKRKYIEIDKHIFNTYEQMEGRINDYRAAGGDLEDKDEEDQNGED